MAAWIIIVEKDPWERVPSRFSKRKLESHWEEKWDSACFIFWISWCNVEISIVKSEWFHMPKIWFLMSSKSWLIGKDSDAGRDWEQEEKRTTEDEMAGWHHRLDGREFEWTLVVGDGQGGLECCNSWGRKESDTTERLNWTELNLTCRLPWWLSGKEFACQCRKWGFSPRVRKIPWRKKW